MERIRQWITAAVFLLIVFGFAAAHFILPDKELSSSERRYLEQAPDLTSQAVFSGRYMADLEKYLLDQFPLRDSFRGLNAVTRLKIFRQKDVNGIYLQGDRIFKREYPLNEKQLGLAVKKLRWVKDALPAACRVYYSVIPDKNYFVAAEAGVPALDYEKMEEILAEGLPDFTYIDLFGTLTIDDYYRTDTHWRQERIIPVARALLDGMGIEDGLPDLSDFTPHTLSPFYGVYYGQAALPLPPEDLVYLTSEATDSATVTSIEAEGTLPVYNLAKWEGMDGYDVYLSGAQALMMIENPRAATDRELIVFRDSFGSSLTPLLLGSYRKITLVDLRYLSSTLLSTYVDFTDQDVLFLYSTMLYNSGGLLK